MPGTTAYCLGFVLTLSAITGYSRAPNATFGMTSHEVELKLPNVVLAIPKPRKQPFEDPALERAEARAIATTELPPLARRRA